MTVHTEILLIAIAVSIACAIPGVFLVLRRMSMMADAITHTVFLGIVLAFFVTEDSSTKTRPLVSSSRSSSPLPSSSSVSIAATHTLT